MRTKFFRFKWMIFVCAAFSAGAFAQAPDSTATDEVRNLFQTTNSTYRDVSVYSTVAVRLTLESVPEIITISVLPVGELSTEITVSGLEINTDYYKYIDGIAEGEKLTTDGSGSCMFTVGLEKAHVIFIKPRPSTIHVPPLPGTVDGRWNPEFRTFTLSGDITSSDSAISIEGNNILLEGNGRTVSIAGGNGVTVASGISGVKIRNLTVTGCTYGIYLISTTADSILDCSFSNNREGIRISNSNNNTVSRCTFTANSNSTDEWTGAIGIWVNSSYNTVERNQITNNGAHGIYMNTAKSNLIRNNTITGNTRYGVRPDNSSNSNTISFNTAKANLFGVEIYNCQSNIVKGNLFSANAWAGLRLIWSSSTNQVTRNNFINNVQAQILALGSAPSLNENYWSQWTNSDANNDGYADAQPAVMSPPSTFPGHLTISDPLPLANPVGPNISNISTGPFVLGQPIEIAATAEVFLPSLATVSGIKLQLDGGAWVPMSPSDLAFDEKVEDGFVALPAFATPGTHTILLRGTDSEGYVGLDYQATFEVRENRPPMANAGVDQTVPAGAQCNAVVTLNGSGSSDPDNDPLTYTWTGSFGSVLGQEVQVTVGLGSNDIELRVIDSYGRSATDHVIATVNDIAAPVPNVASLPTITNDCSVTLTAPTATDACAGVITATTTDPLTYLVQGTYTVTWTYNDGNGNTSTQTQTVIVDDQTAPVPTVASLPTISGECSVTLTAPTATDACAGVITATTTDPLAYSVQGTYTVTWTYNDGNGNTSTQTQTVIVDDQIAPVANVATLPTATGECSVTLTAPTATDACAGVITATTTDPLTYLVQGTYTVTWTYNDGNGNTSTQTQTVIVDDQTAPVPNVASLPTINGECSVTLTAPMATDACAGVITATTTSPLTYSAQGTYTVTWTYSDGNGNTSTQTQTVIVDDQTAPVPTVASLPTISGECSVTLTAPTATDACAGVITATTTDPVTYSAQGTYTVTWTYNDGNGNTSTQTQTVIVDDQTAPVPNVGTLPTINGECSVTLTAPMATDACAGVITATTTSPLTYSAQGTYTVTWTYNDGNGNVSTQTQTVVVDDQTAPVPNVTSLPTINGECSVTLTAPTATDACAGVITATTTDPLTYSVQGTYTVTWTYNDGNGNTSTQTQTVIVKDVTAPEPNISPLPTIAADNSITLDPPSAVDNCAGSITATTTTAFPITSRGTHTVEWTYSDGNGNTSSQFQTVLVYYTTSLSVSVEPAQYSDTATFTAILKASDGSRLAGKTISWSISGSMIGNSVTNGDGVAILRWKDTFAAGSYTVVADFAGDPGNHYRSASSAAELALLMENSTVTYTGLPIVPLGTSLVLRAHVTQEADTWLGDPSKAKVTFAVTRNTAGILVDLGTYEVSCNLAGDASYTVPNAVVGVYSITMTVTGGYYTSTPEGVIVPVYDPKGGFATGGGFIVVTNPAEGDLGRANFGFNAKYEKGGNSTGNLEFQYKNGDVDMKSTSIDWLVVSATNAQFQGTATIVGREGLFTFRVNCTDNLSNGKPDKFSIWIWQGPEADGSSVYKALNQDLAGGNILVKNK